MRGLEHTAISAGFVPLRERNPQEATKRSSSVFRGKIEEKARSHLAIRLRLGKDGSSRVRDGANRLVGPS